jgi:hypothetical protein
MGLIILASLICICRCRCNKGHSDDYREGESITVIVHDSSAISL